MKHNKYSDYKILNRLDKLKSFVEGEITAPLYVRVKPINLCNHGCFFCAYSTGFRVKDGGEEEHIMSGMHENMQEKDVIPFPKMRELLHNFWEMGVKAVTYSGGGEPLMYPEIVKTMQETLDYGIDLSIITNGQNLAKERAEVLSNAKWVRVSMDYTNGSEMKRFRNVPEKSFDSVIANMANFAKIKSAVTDLGVNFIVHRNNYKNLGGLARLLKESGVENVRFSPMYVPDFYSYHAEIEQAVNEQLKEIQTLVDDRFSVNSTYNINSISHSPNRSYKRCYIMQTIPVVAADLNVYACHNKAYDGTGCMGSIQYQSFKQMWFSPATKLFMQSFNARHKCLHECSNDRKNILINGFLDASTDNFI